MSSKAPTTSWQKAGPPTVRVELGQPPFGVGVKYPIRLTAQNSFVPGRAALAFVSPHLLIPADDVALFGKASGLEWTDEGGSPYAFEPPYEEARIVAWFHPPELDRTYVIDFTIEAAPGTYTLESTDTETTQVPEAALLDEDKHLSTTFHPGSDKWRPFTLSGSMYWALKSCEFNVLP